MKKDPVHTIVGKVACSWLPEHQAMLDEWTSYFVSLEEFKAAVMKAGVAHSKKNGGRAWIVDSSKAKGVFADEIQQYIGSTCFKEFVAAGVKYFITIRSQVSSSTNLTVARYERQAGPAGIQLVTVDSLAQALAFLADVDQGRAAA